MAQNKKVLNQFKAMQRQINEITPNIYASIAIALSRFEVSHEDIAAIFAESQAIWEECVNSDVNMREMCLNETGIDVQRTVNDK